MLEVLPKPTGTYGRITWSRAEGLRQKLLKYIKAYHLTGRREQLPKHIKAYIQARNLFFHEYSLGSDEPYTKVLCVPYEEGAPTI